MSDTLTPAQRSYNMSRIRSRNTSPERAVRHALWHKGYRYRLNDKRLPGSPDLVLPKYRAVIFINGCFWHGHRGCTKYVVPKTNEAFWRDVNGNGKCTDFGNRVCSDFGNNNAPISVTTIHNFR